MNKNKKEEYTSIRKVNDTKLKTDYVIYKIFTNNVFSTKIN